MSILNVSQHEAELLRDAVLFWQARLCNASCDSLAHKAAGIAVYRQCERIVVKLDAVIAKGTTA